MKIPLILATSIASAFAAPVAYDIVVYGGTSGGVIAAKQAAKSGSSVLLISQMPYLGGMTSSGLGWSDLGDTAILGGLSREFYHRIYLHYQGSGAWDRQTRASFGNHGQGASAFDEEKQIGSVFEPKIAARIFSEFLKEDRVDVVTGRLDLKGGVVMDGGMIRLLRLEDGREFAGKMFVDATYEGDLLPGAGVTFTVGREANERYGESYNGVQTKRAVKNQLPDGIDPFVTPGNPTSGLLPGVHAGPSAADGAGDKELQAFCYRMVLTDVPANRVAILKPPGYQEADYELLFRAIEAGQKTNFFKLDLMPNRKTDSNNTGGISTDFIGRNYGPDWDWTTLNHRERDELAKQHELWQRGLVWTLQNHPRVPEAIRAQYSRWGLPADEFVENGNWPWQIYVREGRRMVSDFVMTESHCEGKTEVSDPIGLAAYTMDSHHVRRQVVNGMVKNEGDVQMKVSKPYGISYRSIIPRRGECGNLLVPWSLSASHIAFGSIRMEPVFMTLSQSAAIAAHTALKHKCNLQDISYDSLRAELRKAGIPLGSQ
jgi:hypothetical protein